MPFSTTTFTKIGLAIILFAISFLVLSFDLTSMFDVQEKQEIHILDQEGQAIILEVHEEKKSALLKGSILDYEGIFVTYEFKANDQIFHKTELIKKSDGNISQIIQLFDQQRNENNKIAVRYNSKDPRKSAIDVSNVIASS